MPPNDEWREALRLAWDEIHQIEYDAGLPPYTWQEVEWNGNGCVMARRLTWGPTGPEAGPWKPYEAIEVTALDDPEPVYIPGRALSAAE